MKMDTRTVSTLLIVVIFRFTGADGEVCSEHQQGFEGSCFEFVALQRSFLGAQSWCERGGGHLAFIHNHETQQFLQKHLQPEPDWWLGLVSSMEGSWLDGSDVSYSNWLSESMSGPGCGYIAKDSEFQWRTTSNCSQEFYFICQFESGHSLVCADHNATLQCGSGQVIEIDESFYGRKTLHYCRPSSSPSQTPSLEECSWADVAEVVSEFCNGTQVCEVAADAVSIEESCPGLGNYLSIKYHCTDESQISAKKAKMYSSKFKRSAEGNQDSNQSDDSSDDCKSNDSSKECKSKDKSSEDCKSNDDSKECKSKDKSSEDCKSNDDSSKECKSKEKSSEDCKSNDDSSKECKSKDKSPEDCKSNDDSKECKSKDKSSEDCKSNDDSSKECKSMDKSSEDCKSNDDSKECKSKDKSSEDCKSNDDSKECKSKDKSSEDCKSNDDSKECKSKDKSSEDCKSNDDSKECKSKDKSSEDCKSNDDSKECKSKDKSSEDCKSNDDSKECKSKDKSSEDCKSNDDSSKECKSNDKSSEDIIENSPGHGNSNNNSSGNGNPAGNSSGNGNPVGIFLGNGNPVKNSSGNSNPEENFSGSDNPEENFSGNGNPEGNFLGNGNPKGNSSGNINPAGNSSGNINPEGNSSGKGNPEGNFLGNDNPAGNSSGNINPKGNSSSNGNPAGNSSGNINPKGNSSSNGNPVGNFLGNGNLNEKIPTTPLPALLTNTTPGISVVQLLPPICIIDPPVGDVLSPFRITCTTAEPFCCYGSCSICLTTSDGYNVYCGSDMNMRSLFLPQGNKNNHYILVLKVFVRNSGGFTVNTTLLTQVRDTSCDSTVEDLQTLVFHYKAQVQQHGLFSASMLAQMFQSVSSRLNRGLGEDISAKKKLREDMLTDMCAALTYGEPLKVLSEVQVTADVVLNLVTTQDELTYNAELQACCVLTKASLYLIPMSPTDINATAMMMQTSTSILQSASNILQASANMEEQREICSIILKIADNVQSALLANRNTSQLPVFLISPLIGLYVNRLLPGELPNHFFTTENSISATFILPPLGPSVLPPDVPVDVRMLSFQINPFFWNKADPISGVVGGLSLTRDNGSIIPVTNLNKEIVILLPKVPAVNVNSTFLDLRKYTTLAINVTTPNTSLVLKLEPSVQATLQLYLGFQYYPNDTHYKAKVQLPQPRNSTSDPTITTEERYTWVLGPRDMRVEAGLYNLLVRPVAEAGVNSSNVTVFITSFAAECKYWDETKTNWSDFGCRVGPRSTPQVTQCLCTHLTFFGSSFFVMPNTVDVTQTAALFATFYKNPVVVCFVISLFLFYILVVIWARRADLKDKVKVKVMVLEDNDPVADYRYLLIVSTGFRRGASTSSHVMVTLIGSVWESEPHHLTDPDKPVFERGGVDLFLLTTPFSLGEIHSIRLWHDNSGKNPSWYVNTVMVLDLETGQKWQFLCSSWLATDIGDCTLEKVFPVATEKELKGFSNLFFRKTVKDLCDGHLWYSVVSRPASSTFTRVQRVSCCFSLLLCSMLTSIMFWGVPTDPNEQSTESGEIKFKWQQVMIGIQSSIIMFPINLLIVSIFRLSRPRKKNQPEEKDQPSKPGSPQQEKQALDTFPQWCKQTDITVEFVIKDIKRMVRSLCKIVRRPDPKNELESERKDINALLSLLEEIIQQQDFTLGKFGFEEAQNNFFSVYKFYRKHLYKQLQNLEKELRLLGPSQFSKQECYNQAVQQVLGMKKELESHLSSSCVEEQVMCISRPAGGKKTCCQKGLPWWFVFVAWFLVAATSGVCAFFTMLYGLKYGKERSISWLISITVSFFESLLLTQPVKVLGFAVFFALVVKSVDNDEDDEEYIFMLKDQVFTYSDDPDDVRISRRDSTCSFYQPPPPSDIEKMKENMIKEQKAFALIREILIYVLFLCVLLVAAYGQKDPNAYFLSDHIKESFKNCISDSMSQDNVFAWANSTLLSNLFGHRLGFITDGNSKLVGNARLRQVRVQKNSCRISGLMRPYVPDCHAPYSWDVEDMGSYGPGWTSSVEGNVSEPLLMAWQYQTQSRLRAHPVWGGVALYRGGGYVVDVGPYLENASSVLQYLFDNAWLDVYTRAVFVEFTVYNANVNLFCIVTLMLENIAVGAYQYRSELQNVRLYQTTNNTYVLVSEAIYFLFILYYMFLQFKLMKQQKWEYFRKKWNLFELAIILLSWGTLCVFIKRMVLGDQDLKYYQNHRNQFPSFYETAAADSTLEYLIAFLVLLSTIKMWHLMRLNSKLNMITSTLQRAWTDISSFIVVIFIMLLAYSILSNLLFGWKLETYKTVHDAAMAVVSLQLGIFNYEEVLDLNPVLGAFMIFSCIIFMTFVVLNLFISVILQSFSHERRHHKASEEEEIVDLMFMKICNFFGIKAKKK